LISDGSNKIYHVDPSTFKVFKTVSVVDSSNKNINNLNELELYKGVLLANVYMQTKIVAIDY